MPLAACGARAEPSAQCVCQYGVARFVLVAVALVPVLAACQTDTSSITTGEAPPARGAVGVTPPPADSYVVTQADAVVPDYQPGCDRQAVEAYMADTGLTGWVVGDGAAPGVTTVMVPDERPDVAAAVAAALTSACGETLAVSTGPSIKPVGG